jgi:hypothetical protein
MARRKAAAGPLMLARIAFASSETLARRWWLMATGSCSAGEYRRMLLEKLKASQQMGAAAMSKNPSLAKLLTPWDRATRRNARRLRKKPGWRL